MPLQFQALAADYDGTLAHDGVMEAATVAALERLKASGRRLLMVTGRELKDLFVVCPRLDLFDRVVAENGALVYTPADGHTRLLEQPPPPEFVNELVRRGVGPISVGHVIVATWEPHEVAVLDVIRQMGLELHVIFNKGAVMVLPSSVNKATGLAAALKDLGLSAHNTVAIGDAENDHAFLKACECGVAVANALPALKQVADWVAPSRHGQGVCSLIEQLLSDDLSSITAGIDRHRLKVGKKTDGSDALLRSIGETLLISGPAKSGKSVLAASIVSQLTAAKYQSVTIDIAGTYSRTDPAVALGSSQRLPLLEEVMEVLRHPDRHAIVNLCSLAPDHRQRYFREALEKFAQLRESTGRPHWIIVDEAHQLMPVRSDKGNELIRFEGASNWLLVSEAPDQIAPEVMQRITTHLQMGSPTLPKLSPDQTRSNQPKSNLQVPSK